jgi:hypothetical protein
MLDTVAACGSNAVAPCSNPPSANSCSPQLGRRGQIGNFTDKTDWKDGYMLAYLLALSTQTDSKHKRNMKKVQNKFRTSQGEALTGGYF